MSSMAQQLPTDLKQMDASASRSHSTGKTCPSALSALATSFKPHPPHPLAPELQKMASDDPLSREASLPCP